MKRPEGSRYVIPALRIKSSKECEDGMEDHVEDKGQNASETFNMQSNFFRKHGSSQRRHTNIVPRQIRFDSSSSSSNPKKASNESYTDDDSSDFEECGCDIVTTDNLRIEKETAEDDSNDQSKRGVRERPTQNDHGIEIGHYGVKAEISNKLLMQQKDYLDLKYLANQELDSESNEKKFGRNLFYNYGDSSLSDIEAVIDSFMKKGSVLTSTPNSCIVDERILDAAKYAPQGESAMESTLLGESDMQTAINSNRNNCDYNFEIFHDPPSVKKQSKDYSEVFGHNYIPPPVPPSAHIFRLPPIHRLPTPFSSTYKLSVQRPVSLQPSGPCATSIQPSGPGAASFQPSGPRAASFKPSGPGASFQPSGPRAASPKPSVPGPVSLQTSVPHPFSLQPPVSRLIPIQPPVPRSIFPQLSVSRSVFPQHMPQLFTQLRHPRHLLPQSLQLYSYSHQYQPCKSSNIQHIPRHISPCMRPGSEPLSSDPPYTSSSILPPLSLEVRAISPHSPQEMINLPNLELYKQDGQFYIPPPVPPPWMRGKSSDLRS